MNQTAHLSPVRGRSGLDGHQLRFKQPPLTAAESRVLALAERLRHDLGRPISREQAAKLASVEKTHFSKVFKAVIGMTFLEWNRVVRVEAARPLLRQDGMTVTEIASALGYGDLTTFERHFKRIEGISPTRYRYARWR